MYADFPELVFLAVIKASERVCVFDPRLSNHTIKKIRDKL